MYIQFSAVVHLMHSCSSGVLATHSEQMTGYPYATILPFVLDESHRPVFLVSGLAEHTKNLLTDPRASLLLSDSDGQQVLKSARVTLIGDVEHFSPSEQFINRYLRYQPDAKQYLELADFVYLKLMPKRARYIAGFSEMGWVAEADWHNTEVLSLSDEENICRAVTGDMPKGIRFLGVDCYGFDTESDGQRIRHKFADAPISSSQLEDVLRRFLKALDS
jgi:heme iron utilization protein